MRIDARLPNQLAGLRPHCVEPAEHVSEKQRVPVAKGHGHDRGAHRAIGLKHPLQATGVRAHSVHEAGSAADEKLAVDDGGRRKGDGVAIKAESPFEFETAHLIDAQARYIPRLKAGVVGARAPAVPGSLGIIGQL